MSLKDDFETAARNVLELSTRPNNDALLKLYSLYKQATEGDVSGKRPSLIDFKSRKKYDSWAEIKGLSKEAAMERYVAFVRELEEA